MTIEGELQALPEGAGMRELMETHLHNMSVLSEIRIKHEALVRWIKDEN